MSHLNLPKKSLLKLLIICVSIMLTACSEKKVSELRLQGIEELQKAKYEDAINTFNEALELSDGKVTEVQYDILIYRAEAEYMTGDLEAARTTIDTLIEVNGEKDEYIRFLAQLDAKKLVSEAAEALNVGDLDTAREKMDKAVSLGIKNDRDLQFDEIVYLEKTAEWEKALEQVKNYLEQYPKDKDAEREKKFLETRVNALKNNEAMNG